MRSQRILILLALLQVAVGAPVSGEGEYAREIKPLLAEKCISCHGALQQEAGLRLDAIQLVRLGGDSGKVLEPGRADRSLILERVKATGDARMPPEGEGEALSPAQIRTLSEWLNAGARGPDQEPVPTGPKDHWAYQPISRPEIPVAATHISNPIDAFIGAKLREHGLTPSPSANAETLVRRLYFDLTGLPPSREAVEKYLAQDDPAAFEHLVDCLLNSPHYGERWGRHWMDVWRYSDWDGFKGNVRGSQRHIWHWREWIIESLNADKSYARMLTEMLAADEVAPEDDAALRATGFLARNWHHSNRNIWLDATVEHTAKAFLGMTLNCARCHDHKYDPIPQQDYYAFRAIFEPHEIRTERLPGIPNVRNAGLPRAFDAKPESITYVFLQGDDRRPDKEHPVAPAVPELFDETLQINPVDLPAIAWFPSLRPHIREEDIAAARRRVTQARRALAKAEETQNAEAGQHKLARLRAEASNAALESLEARWKADHAKVQGETESVADLTRLANELDTTARVRQAEMTVFEQQQYLKTAESENNSANATKARRAISAAKAELKQLRAIDASPQYRRVGTEYPKQSTGRRSALARWITSPKNPLTARVAVNQVWMRHFGAPLVENTFDFGLRATRPKHAELLDWLASEFIDSGWSLHHLHRMIVASRTWQQGSAIVAETRANREVDPDNTFVWKANVRRLDAELVRDSVLCAAGRLDESLGGPDIDFVEGESVYRRSVYFRHAYEKQMKMLTIFDAANPTDCYRRSESIIPQQALALSNSSLSLYGARQLAADLTGHHESNDDFVTAAFRQILGRAPWSQERAASHRFLENQTELLLNPSELNAFPGEAPPAATPSRDPARRARENLVHVLMNHNDFITIR